MSLVVLSGPFSLPIYYYIVLKWHRGWQKEPLSTVGAVRQDRSLCSDTGEEESLSREHIFTAALIPSSTLNVWGNWHIFFFCI